jgi:hypothetical protein
MKRHKNQSLKLDRFCARSGVAASDWRGISVVGVLLLLFVGAGALESSSSRQQQRRLSSAALYLKGGANDDAGYYKALGSSCNALTAVWSAKEMEDHLGGGPGVGG